MNQSDRFKQMARELECDEDEEAFKEKLKRVARQKEAQSPQPDPPQVERPEPPSQRRS